MTTKSKKPAVSKSKILFTLCLAFSFIINSNAQIINTIAGNGNAAFSGDNAAAINAELNGPIGVAIDHDGNIYIGDSDNNRIRKVSAANGFITTIAGTGNPGYSGDGGLATDAEINSPASVVVDDSGNVFFSEYNNSIIRKISATNGIIETVVGIGVYGFDGDGGPANWAQLNSAAGFCFDKNGNMYIADMYNMRIRMVNKASGIITTIAGNGAQGGLGDGDLATNAQLSTPQYVAVDDSGNVYISDTGNNKIRKVSASTGKISTFAGTGGWGYSGDGGVASAAMIGIPKGVIFDHSGNLVITDGGARIRKINLSTNIISTYAGTISTGFSGDGGLATLAQFDNLNALCVDSLDNLIIADWLNHRIRKITPSPISLKENANEKKLSVYPNPAFSNLTINGVRGKAGLIIYDLIGKEIMQLNVISDNTMETSIDVSSLETGIYTLLIADENGRSSRRILIEK